MNAATWASLATAAAAALSALAVYLRQRAHQQDPNAHPGSRFR